MPDICYSIFIVWIAEYIYFKYRLKSINPFIDKRFWIYFTVIFVIYFSIIILIFL